ncbi:type IV pilus assembly protein PilQ [Tenacibaculum skagerrakense]|uniref:Type IV pilus assembly protein PilQ n=2 Tax=Tenacibaculum skagerrakense TaxID=186571 RepID=A0A4R2NNP1_9FLAO|nr:type IV pilus assembly protein PilQ [Tenacibaculum skagerrakense]
MLVVAALLVCATLFGQIKSSRIQLLEKQLDSLQQVAIPQLSEKVTISKVSMDFATIFSSISELVNINFITDPNLKSKIVSYNFENVTVKDLLLHICEKFNLEINSTGAILSVHNYVEPTPIKEKKELNVTYDKLNDLFSIDVKNDTLSQVFKKITEVTGQNLLFGVDMGDKKITSFIKKMPFEGAIEKMAFTNNLEVIKTKDGYYLFQQLEGDETVASNGVRGNDKERKSIRKRRYRTSNFYFKVKDSINKILEVDFENEDVGAIIKDISNELNIDLYTDTNLSNLKKLTFKTRNITFDELLTKILQDEDNLTYKKENNIYYFTNGDKAATKSYVIVPLMHRSIEIMSTPIGAKRNDYDYNSLFNSSSGTSSQLTNGSSGVGSNGYSTNGSPNDRDRRRQTLPQTSAPLDNKINTLQAFSDIIPEEFKDEGKKWNIKIDPELNSFIVAGDPEKIKRFQKFIKKIDKPVPVILIEVMIIEVNKTATVNTGVELGLGSEPVNDSGTLFPSTGVTLGATTLNKVIGGFDGFGSLNIGKVVPNFYAKIQAMETNGNIKIRSTPKLSTLNGHEAVLSNGERSYYAVVRRDIIGSQNPQTTEIRNYVPIDADLSISIKPMVAGDDQITMSINVLQSSFNEANRIDSEAPPGINSREFNSIIRVKNQDVVILGGLEEKLKNDSGSGVPFLARIPIIKWFFSKKTRIDSKKKLSVLIKPTIIR